MKKMKFGILILAVVILFVSTREIQAQQVAAESISILRINEQEERAMIKLPDGRMHILKVGDSIGKNGKVTEIAEGRIVIEERTEKGPETVIIRFESGKQRIERIRKIEAGQPGLYSPSTKGTKGHEDKQKAGID